MDPEVGEPYMFVKGIYLSVFYCLCYVKDIYNYKYNISSPFVTIK